MGLKPLLMAPIVTFLCCGTCPLEKDIRQNCVAPIVLVFQKALKCDFLSKHQIMVFDQSNVWRVQNRDGMSILAHLNLLEIHLMDWEFRTLLCNFSSFFHVNSSQCWQSDRSSSPGLSVVTSAPVTCMSYLISNINKRMLSYVI